MFTGSVFEAMYSSPVMIGNLLFVWQDIYKHAWDTYKVYVFTSIIKIEIK